MGRAHTRPAWHAGLGAAAGASAVACAPGRVSLALVVILVAATAIALAYAFRRRGLPPREAARDRDRADAAPAPPPAAAPESELARAYAALDARLAAAREAGAATRGRILVVDDEAPVARVLARALAAEHDVACETDPARALARLRAGEVFDVVFCDVVMPDLDGVSVHDAVARERPEQAARFVFLTGAQRGGPGTLATLGRDVIEKPYDLDAVRALARARVAAARAAGPASGGGGGASSAGDPPRG